MRQLTFIFHVILYAAALFPAVTGQSSGSTCSSNRQETTFAPSTCSASGQQRHPAVLPESNVQSYSGHYPVNRCRITNVRLDSRRKLFLVGLRHLEQLDICFGTRQIWDFDTWSANSTAPDSEDESEEQQPACDQLFETGHVFTTYYYHGSNYFHLHYDTALPLYYLLHHKGGVALHGRAKNVLFMPSVEMTRGKGTDWNTIAFLDETTYWNRMIEILTNPYRVVPLDARLFAMQKTLCFKEIYFGTPKFDSSDTDVISGFASFVKSRLKIAPANATTSGNIKKNVGLIKRIGRRRILNEENLLSALKQYADVHLLNFSGISLEKQIEEVQTLDVLVGVNGAGLINALYLPRNSVAVQLVPYRAQLNHEEFSVLLKARGPYLDWHNSHSHLSRSVPGDVFNNNPDTVVDVDEFVALIQRALQLCNNSRSR